MKSSVKWIALLLFFIANSVFADDTPNIVYQNYPSSDRLLDTNLPVGRISGYASVSSIGAALYQIPVKVPEGVNGIHPQITIDYNSQRKNGIMGYGWSFSAFSAISRIGATVAYDGYADYVGMDSGDRLFLDGQRLLLASGSNLEIGSTYASYIEDYKKIEFSSINSKEGFVVFSKDGLIYEYGGTADSHITDENNTGTLVWLLSKVRDRFGNYMQYTYADNSTLGDIYISSIEYTGNSIMGTTPINRIDFSYSLRSEMVVSHSYGTPIAQKALLTGIKVSTGNITVKEYKFNYSYDNLYSQLTEIEEYGQNGSKYNSTIISWNDENTRNSTAIINPYYISAGANFDFSKRALFYADFNGDGKCDVMEYPTKNIASSDSAVLYTMGNNLRLSKKCTISHGKNDKLSYIDFDGDGDLDIIKTSKDGSSYRHYFYKFDGNNFSIPNEEHLSTTSAGLYFGDFNGDGRTELLTKDFKLYDVDKNLLAQGGISEWGDDYISEIPNNSSIIDFNGDGTTDILISSSSGAKIYTLVGNTFVQESSFDGSFSIGAGAHLHFADFNGDGCTDIFSRSIGFHDVYTSTSSKFSHRTDVDGFDYVEGLVRVTDYNSDGKDDIILLAINGLINIWEFDGIYFQRKTIPYFLDGEALNIIFNNETALGFADFDGDGLSEFFIPDHLDAYQMKDFEYGHNLFVNCITDGYDQRVRFEYMPLTKSSCYTETSEDLTFPISRSKFPLYVVKSMSNRNSLTGEYSRTLNYEYEDICIHRSGKGILCFKKIIEEDEDKEIKKVSNYDYLPNSHFPYLKSEELLTTNGDTISIAHYGYSETAKNEGGYEIFQTETSNIDYLTGYTVTYNFGQYENGFPRRVTKNIGNSDIIETTTTTYQHVDNSSIRLFGLPTNKSISTRRKGNTAWIEKTCYAYNSSYSVNKKEKYVYDGSKKSLEETYSYDGFGNIITKTIMPYNSTNPLTNSYTYSTDGSQLLEVRNPLDFKTSYQYNNIGLLTKMYDNNGNVTSFYYDDFGNPSKTVYPDNVVETDSVFWSTGIYGALYGVKRTSTIAPMKISYFNSYGMTIRESTQLFDGSMTHVDNAYDWDMQLVQTSLPFKGSSASLWNTYTYDRYGRLTQVDYASGKVDKYSYSGNSVTETKDGITTTRTYDGTGTLLRSKTIAGTLIYNYLSNGNISTIYNSNIPLVRFDYDSYGRRTSIYTQDTGTRRTSYDEVGNVCSEVDANGNGVNYSYDDFSRLVCKETSDGLKTTYAYDSNGNLTQESTNNGVKKIYQYDKLNRISHKFQIENNNANPKIGFQKSFLYENGKISSAIYSTGVYMQYSVEGLGVEKYSYSNGYLVKIRDNLYDDTVLPVWELTGQNEFGQTTSYTTGPLQHTNTYNDYGYLTRITTQKEDTVLQDFKYAFNATTGNLVRRIDALHNKTEFFTYDQLNRLNTTKSETYSYDAIGNIKSHSAIGTYNYDGGLYAVKGITPSSDSRILDTEQQITYDAQMRPTRIATDIASAYFKYDGSGNRVKMIDSLKVSSYIVNGELPIPDPKNVRFITYYDNKYEKIEDYVNNEIKKIFYFGGDAYSAPAAFVNYNDSLMFVYICRDHLGSITHIIDENGALIQELSYDAWGNLRDPATQNVYAFGNEPVLFLGRGYTGHEHLNYYALINMNARLYDPVIGRFLSPDTYTQLPDNLQSYNLYSYCMNNPLCYVDQSGEAWWAFVIAAVVGGGINVATNWDNIDNFWDGLGYFGVGALAGVAGAATFTGAMGVVGVSGVAGGFLAGGASGFASGALLGGGNSIVAGENFMDVLDKATFSAMTGMVGGAISGAVISGATAYFQGKNVWNGTDIAPGRNAFSFKNTPVSESIRSSHRDILPDEMSARVKPDKAMSTVEEAPAHKMSPHEKGKIGVERAIKEFRAEGGTVYSKEVTIEIDGVRTRLDFVGEKDGMLHLFEVKNGPHAGMTNNQKINIPKLQQNYKFIPRGNNASAVQGFTSGKIYDGNYVIIYKHYLK